MANGNKGVCLARTPKRQISEKMREFRGFVEMWEQGLDREQALAIEEGASLESPGRQQDAGREGLGASPGCLASTLGRGPDPLKGPRVPVPCRQAAERR